MEKVIVTLGWLSLMLLVLAICTFAFTMHLHKKKLYFFPVFTFCFNLFIYFSFHLVCGKNKGANTIVFKCLNQSINKKRNFFVLLSLTVKKHALKKCFNYFVALVTCLFVLKAVYLSVYFFCNKSKVNFY